MILKKHIIGSALFFSINGSSDLKFLKVGLEEEGLVLYFVDHLYGDTSKYYNGVVIKNDNMCITSQMKFLGMEAGCAVFIEDYRDSFDSTSNIYNIINELNLQASSGNLDIFTRNLLSFYKEDFIKDVITRLESRDLIDLQLRLVAQAEALEEQLKKKQEVIIQIENLSKELGYQMDFVNKCPAM